MPFLAECILCRQKIRLPDKAAGASVQCPRCGSYFTAAPDELPAPTAKRAEPPAAAAVPVSPRASRVMAANRSDDTAPAKDEPPLSELPLSEPPLTLPQPALQLPIFPVGRPARGEGHGIEPIGAAAILIAGLAGWCAVAFSLAFLVIPLALLGAIVGLVGLVAGVLADPQRWVLAMVGSMANVGLLFAALFLPSWLGATYQLSRERGEVEVITPRVVPLDGQVPASATASGDWPDATRYSVFVKNIRIEVVGAELRPLEIATTPRKKYTKESYLVLRLRMRQPAGGSEFASDAWGQGGNTQDRRQPVLSDESGKAIAPAPANVRAEATTLTKRSADFPLGITDEVYLFEAPPASAQHLHLEVPAEGWGGTGLVRFAIPRTMLKITAPKTPAKVP